MQIDAVGAVFCDVGEKSLLVPDGKGCEVVLIVVNVEVPVLG